MSKPTLLVLAAGMASRYGSLKQMDGVGPSGEAIIDYSIYDAARAGFGKVVFVICDSHKLRFFLVRQNRAVKPTVVIFKIFFHNTPPLICLYIP